MDFEEHAAHEPGRTCCSCQTCRCVETGQPYGLGEHDATHTCRGCAEREAKREFPLPLADVSAHDGIQAN